MKHKIVVSKLEIGEAPIGAKFKIRRYKEIYEDVYGDTRLIYSAVSVDKYNGESMGFFEEFPLDKPELLDEAFAEVFEVVDE